MKNVLVLVIHLLTVVAKLLGPGGIKGIIAENLLLKQQLLVVCRPRQRAPNLLPYDRVVFGLFSLFLRPGRIPSCDFMIIWCVGNIEPCTRHITEANLDPKVHHKNLSTLSSN